MNGNMKDRTFSQIINDWEWILSYTNKYKKKIAIYIMLGIVSTSLGVVSSVASKHLIDVITGYQAEKLAVFAAVMVGGNATSLILKSLFKRISARMSLDIHNDIQADVFDKIMDADWFALKQYANGDVLNRFNSDIGVISKNAVSWVPTVIITGYRFLVTFLVILYYDKVMAVIALLSAPFLFLTSRFILKRQREYGQKMRKMGSDLMAFESETFYNVDTIKSFGVASDYSRKMRHWQRRFKEISLKYNLFSIKTDVWLTLLNTMVQYAAFGYCLYCLWTGNITIGTMTLFLQQRSQLSAAFQNVVAMLPAFVECSVSAQRIRELEDMPKEVHIMESSELDRQAAEGFEVRMKDVNFSYIEGEKIISDSEFVARPGEIVALVGPSGEGKTTMIRLILGLVRPEEGKTVIVAANGREVRTNVETRHLFAYVPQGNTIFSGSIADNLRMVKRNATDEELVEVLKIACAWEFVEKLPDTLYGKVGEKGNSLSEGQAQRIAIARAILRDTPVLLLDEATSALDVETEQKVLQNIIRQRPNKTCIVTTHRPSVLSLCQKVYRVMETKVTELDEKELSRMAIDF